MSETVENILTIITFALLLLLLIQGYIELKRARKKAENNRGAAEKRKIKINEIHRCPLCGRERNKGYIYMHEQDLGVKWGIHEKAVTGLCPDCYKQIN